jgi:hypothetical protein
LKREDNIKTNLEETEFLGCKTPGLMSVVISSEDENGTLVSTSRWELSEKLRNYEILKDSAP